MQKTRKGLAVGIVTCMAVSMLAACSGKENNAQSSAPASSSSGTGTASASAQPTQQAPLKFTYHSLSRDVIPQDNNEMYTWLKANKNVDIKAVADPQKDKMLDKLNLMLASGDVPDVLEFENVEGAVEIAKKMGESGLVISLDDWLAKYPDLLANHDKAYDDAVYRDKDGKMYVLPINLAAKKGVQLADVGPIVRGDWLKQVGMSAPKTTDELYEVLKAFKDKIPDVNGKKIIPATFDVFRQYIADAWTKSWVKFGEDGKLDSYQFTNPDIEGYMVFMNKLYREGLLDPEMLTQQSDQYMEKLSSGRVGYSVRIYWDMDTVNKALKANSPETRFVPAPPLTVTGSSVQPVYANPSDRSFNSLVISAKFAKDPANVERLMEFLNWSASPEGTQMLRYGEEGKYYVKNAEGLLEKTDEANKESAELNNTFLQRTGLDAYNILRIIPIPSVEANPRTEESKLGTEVWAPSVGEPLPLSYQLVPAGPIEQQKWGSMWSELDKWTAKAVYAKSEEEARKVTKEMLEAFEKNGGRDIVNERVKSMSEFK
ncbi:hypothetical protein [Cohnella sp. GCM10012308]|uniref:hypothetical protein n=1 Tax=Cohnella sp. GCM10012308 TaxID=3317329 RepID=UPI0036147214